MRYAVRWSVATILALGTVVALSTGAMAVKPDKGPSEPLGIGTLDPGVACAFAVSIDLISGDQGQAFTFFDQSGNVVREMGTARPSTWRITNLESHASRTVDLPAGHLRSSTAPDGTMFVDISGGSIGFNGPTDTPPGPFAFTNVGHLVLAIRPDGTGTLVSVTGRRFDLCQAVAP